MGIGRIAGVIRPTMAATYALHPLRTRREARTDTASAALRDLPCFWTYRSKIAYHGPWMIGRPQEFDRDEALEKAMEVFWTKGYEAASVEDLLDCMGINRGSMYNTFGDKQALFVEAVEHYCERLRDRFRAILEGPGSPLGNVRKLLANWEKTLVLESDRGCLVTNTAVELAPHVPVVGELIRSHLSQVEKILHPALVRAIKAGELAPEANPRALARFLISALQGLAVIGKTASSPAAVKDVVRVTLSALK